MFLSIIAWFLVDEAYYSIHRDFPMGDRSHFQVGIKETYFEYFSVNSLHDLAASDCGRAFVQYGQ